MNCGESNSRSEACARIGASLSGYVDRRLAGADAREVAEHLKECRQCRTRAEEILQLRTSLRTVPARPVPAQLAMKLRVAASREGARRRSRLTWRARLQEWRTDAKLYIDNLMRPLALPFAGGLASAVVLFSMLVPTFTVHAVQGMDVPTAPLYTEATLKNLMPLGTSVTEVVVDVVVDEQGRMVDYSFPSGQGWTKNSALRREVENMLLFAEFTPATSFGQPTMCRMRLSILRRGIDVKG